MCIRDSNKVCKTLDDAISRARNIAAPINIQRFNDLKTPCYLKGSCANCKSTESICCLLYTSGRFISNKIKSAFCFNI